MSSSTSATSSSIELHAACSCAGAEVTLASKEYALLLRMAQDPDRVFTREQLLRDVWGYRTFVPTRTVESHASRVRCKLAAAGLPGWIVNVWGVGYRLRPALL